MAYEGYLIKIGDYEISREKFIKAKSYSAKRNPQDSNSFRDANGILHRNVLGHVPLKVEFETPANLTNSDIAQLFNSIEEKYIKEDECKVLATVYVPKKDSYITQEMYLVEPEFPIDQALDDVIIYGSIRIAFIGY